MSNPQPAAFHQVTHHKGCFFRKSCFDGHMHLGGQVKNSVLGSSYTTVFISPKDSTQGASSENVALTGIDMSNME
ncbi:hypothetical protein [Roseobacter sp. A03A-229]